MGQVVLSRLRESPEGPFVGAYILDTGGAQTSLELPVENLGFGGVWATDGGRLLVNAFDGQQMVLGLLDPGAGTFAPIHPQGMDGELECSDWAPDAQRVICRRSGPDPDDDGIYTVDVESGEATRLTTSPYHHVVGTAGECGGGESRAVYSSDGDRFAFIQQKCGSGANPSADEEGAIVVASANGADQRVIVPLGGVRTHPGGEISWSPTGDLIAFGTQDGDLSIIKADGSDLRTLDLDVRGYAYGPTWSPDGKWLLVSIFSRASQQDDLYVIGADGSAMVQITDTPEVEAYTDWGVQP